MIESPRNPRTMLHSPRFPQSAGLISISIIQAKLHVNLAIIGSMKTICRVSYLSHSFSTAPATGLIPQWDRTHNFIEPGVTVLYLSLIHRSFLISERVVGHCTIQYKEVIQGHLKDWWNLVNDLGEVVGCLLLAFEITGKVLGTPISSISTNQSMDFRENFCKKNQERTPGVGHLSSRVLGSEDLDNDTFQLKTLKTHFEKTDKENEKLEKSMLEAIQQRDRLMKKEAYIAASRGILTKEKKEIENEKRRLNNLRNQINKEYVSLKKEKLKIQVHSKLIRCTSKKLTSDGERVSKVIQFISQKTHEENVKSTFDEYKGIEIHLDLHRTEEESMEHSVPTQRVCSVDSST